MSTEVIRKAFFRREIPHQHLLDSPLPIPKAEYEFLPLTVVCPSSLPPPPANPALPFNRNRRIAAFYQNLIRLHRPTMQPKLYRYYLRKLRFFWGRGWPGSVSK